MSQELPQEIQVPTTGTPPDMLLFYNVLLQKRKEGVSLYLERNGSTKRAKIGYYKNRRKKNEQKGGTLSWLSDKPRGFFDDEDEDKLLKECKKLLPKEEGYEKSVGSIALCLVLLRGRIVELYYDENPRKFAEWDPDSGLRFFDDSHPAFKKDRAFIAQECTRIPQGSGGVFAGLGNSSGIFRGHG